MLAEAFCREGMTKKEGKEIILSLECPRVELPYAYLMAWFVMHYPSLIKSGKS